MIRTLSLTSLNEVHASFIITCFSLIFQNKHFSILTAASTTPATSTTCTATVPPQPQYSYHDINVYSLGGLAPHITLNPTVSTDLVC